VFDWMIKGSLYLESQRICDKYRIIIADLPESFGNYAVVS
jgi:hypothetical protein